MSRDATKARGNRHQTESKMKTKIFIIGLVATCFVATAFLTTLSFPGWGALTQSSPDIIIARCTMTPDPLNEKTNGIGIDIVDGLINSDIEVISVLKGATNTGPARLYSQYWPRQSEYYLIFADYHDGYYQACEAYRIMPLGVYFYTNSIAGKPLDKQLQILFKHRLDDLNRQMKDEQEEKQRLEEALTK